MAAAEAGPPEPGRVGEKLDRIAEAATETSATLKADPRTVFMDIVCEEGRAEAEMRKKGAGRWNAVRVREIRLSPTL
jgi:hypothetical protein